MREVTARLLARIHTYIRNYFVAAGQGHRGETRPTTAPLPASIAKTRRLLLREWEETDAPAVHAYRSDPEVLRYQERTEPYNEEETWRLVLLARNQRFQMPRCHYWIGIVLREEERLIGECGLRLYFPGGDAGSPPDIATLGFMLHRHYWGRGYATEAAEALLRFAFGELNLKCVYAGCLPENVASRGVLEKAGMTLQGRQKDFPGAPLGQEALVFFAAREAWLAAK